MDSELFQCPLMFSDAFWCLLMPTDAFQCRLMPSDAFWWLLRYFDAFYIFWCVLCLLFDVFWGLWNSRCFSSFFLFCSSNYLNIIDCKGKDFKSDKVTKTNWLPGSSILSETQRQNSQLLLRYPELLSVEISLIFSGLFLFKVGHGLRLVSQIPGPPE